MYVYFVSVVLTFQTYLVQLKRLKLKTNIKDSNVCRGNGQWEEGVRLIITTSVEYSTSFLFGMSGLIIIINYSHDKSKVKLYSCNVCFNHLITNKAVHIIA